MHPSTSPAVNLVDFIDAMEKRWLGFHNAPSKALRATWKQIAETFKHKLREHGTPFAEDWHVLQPPTGSGKTQSTVVYASRLATECPEQGMMIVTRLIADADTIAREVNELAGRQVAVAHHSDNKLPRESLKDYPILVVTHAAYVRALELDKDGFASGWYAFRTTPGSIGVGA